jgi:hypothetical protein
MIPRRTFLKSTGALAALGNFTFLGRLPSVTAAEATLDPRKVQFHPDIEPLVRLLEDTPRERVIEEVGGRIRRGLSYRDVLTALMLAGVREIQPRPVGFKFHAVLVVNSAHLASLASPDSDRWLPIFWAIDQFKNSQGSDVREGDWKMAPVDEAAVPSSHKARQAFIDAMDRWDEPAADAAIAGLVRSAGEDELFDLFAHYGARDFRDIGHKAIYVSNSFRTLQVIGWQHAEPVLRSLAYALLAREGAKENPSTADLPADRPFRENLPLTKQLPETWLAGEINPGATRDLLATVRSGTAHDTSAATLQLLTKGVAPQSIFEALFLAAGELLMQEPGILSIHAMTSTNALHYAWHRTHSDETRRLLLLQNTAFLPLFRRKKDSGLHLESLEPLAPAATGEEALTEIFTDLSRDRLTAARKVLAHLQSNPDPKPFAQAARRLIFLKGRDSHDYKFSSAVLEDYERLTPVNRHHLLAASVFNLKGSAEKDNEVVKRTRAALGA